MSRSFAELRAAVEAYEAMEPDNPNHPDPDGVILDAHANPEEVRGLLDRLHAIEEAARPLVKDHAYWLNPDRTAALRKALDPDE